MSLLFWLYILANHTKFVRYIEKHPYVMWTTFWNWLKWIFGELWATLSTSPSHLSSKRVERMVFTVTVVTITWIINMYNLGKWTSTDHVITLTPLLIAAGYNIVQERKDKGVAPLNDKETDV